jgi:NADH-quinone oxidoreductase subunit C
MPTPEQIKDRIAAAFPGAPVELVPNGCPAGQPSLLLEPGRARDIARFLRDDPELRFDYASNVTGVDWPERLEKPKPGEPAARKTPAFLEAVYHLYSMALGHGPLVIRLRTGDRAARVTLPSLTPVWRSCEFQEREIFDLFGIIFDGHPDLRRLLMWDNFAGHPMRKDYAPARDPEAEP